MVPAAFPRFLCLAGLMLTLVGCGSGGKLGGVTVAVEAIRTAQAISAGTTATVSLKFTNENVVPVGISSAKHKLYLNNTFIAQSLHPEAVGMPQLSTAKQEVPFKIESASAAALLRELAKNPQAAYRLESVLYVIAGEEKLEIKTQHQGAVDLTGLKVN